VGFFVALVFSICFRSAELLASNTPATTAQARAKFHHQDLKTKRLGTLGRLKSLAVDWLWAAVIRLEQDAIDARGGESDWVCESAVMLNASAPVGLATRTNSNTSERWKSNWRVDTNPKRNPYRGSRKEKPR